MLVLLFVSFSALAQDDLEMADYYYTQGQFEQAKLYYERIYKTNRTTRVYTNYLNTLLSLNQFDEAEKLVKKRIKTENEDGVGNVQLGELYKRMGRNDDAAKEFEDAVRKLQPTRNNVSRLASEFSRISEYGYALQVYQKGKANNREGYSFSYEIASMQGSMGDYDSMIESFLDLLTESPAYLQTVQTSLSRILNFEENPENLDLLKTKLLKRVQKNPEQTIYAEILVWLFMQKKDFNGALVQAIALDKRLEERGLRIINLAQVASTNKDYSTAAKAYQYVVDKGPSTEYYLMARIEKLRALSAELSEKKGIDKSAFQELSNDYRKALNELGAKAETAMMMKEFAHIQAFYLNHSDSAVAILKEAIALPGLYGKVLAACKLELGDIDVFRGDIWDASLLYSQVELDFKDDQLGNEARFRNARISYFTGDFEWAQGQLDALKASTSKLISNDAIDLSLLITDNYNMDTTTAAMKLYARADLLRYQNRFDEANLSLDSLLKEFPSHALHDEVLMMKADMEMKQAHFERAAEIYQKVIDEHPSDITADDALFHLASLNEEVFHRPEEAMKLYEKLITDYPGSLFIIESRKRFRSLRGDQMN